MASLIPSFFGVMLPVWMEIAYYYTAKFIIWIPFLVSIVLSFNRDARGFIVKSSEFWIKLLYAMTEPILYLIRYHYVWRHHDNWPSYLAYVSLAADMVIKPLTIIVVGGSDAIPNMQYRWKAVLAGTVALLYTKGAIEWQFLTPRDLDFKVYIKTTKSEISFHSLLANVNGMIAMFLWKQTIDVIRNRGRCISITYRPYLEWVRLNQKSNPNDLDEHNSDSVAEDGEAQRIEVDEAKETDSKSDLQGIACCS